MRRSLLASAVVLSASFGAATVARGAGASAASSATHAVVLKDISFTPASLKIKAGDRVTWRWEDGPYVPHNIHSTGRLRFAGAPDKKAGTHTVRFAKRGVYSYRCTIHAGMTGKITVR